MLMSILDLVGEPPPRLRRESQHDAGMVLGVPDKYAGIGIGYFDAVAALGT